MTGSTKPFDCCIPLRSNTSHEHRSQDILSSKTSRLAHGLGLGTHDFDTHPEQTGSAEKKDRICASKRLPGSE